MYGRDAFLFLQLLPIAAGFLRLPNAFIRRQPALGIVDTGKSYRTFLERHFAPFCAAVACDQHHGTFFFFRAGNDAVNQATLV